MGNSHHSDADGAKGLNGAVQRAGTRSGRLSVSGRYHRLPKRLEDDYLPLSTVLGSGCSGSVFLAQEKATQAEFAVKGFKLDGLNSDRRGELENELEVFLEMDHPHVARLVDVYESRNMLQLVMECMSGGEVVKRVIAKKRFSEKDAADAAWQMLLAISYIHSHSIVHRDIKLENFLYESKDSDYLKLIDFGFSKVFPHNVKLHASCGTLAYVAPEVLDEEYDERCDMWSYGVTVFVMLFGYMPFSGSEQRQMLHIKAGRYTKKPEIWSKVSRLARNFVESLLVVDVRKRLTSDRALEHAWIAKRDSLEHGYVDHGIVDALTSFSQASRFRRVCMEMMAWSLTNREQQQVRDAFIELDMDRDGAISLREFKQVLETKFHIDDEKAREAFEALDVNHHDEIHYADFLAAMVSSRISLHDHLLSTAFKRFDVDESGYITAEDLREVLGESFEGEDIEQLMNEVAVENGQISLDDFIAFVKHPDAKTPHTVAAQRIIDSQIAHPDHARSRAPVLQRKRSKEGTNASMGRASGCLAMLSRLCDS